MTDRPEKRKAPPMTGAEKVRWWLYYHLHTQKGRYEVYHFAEWLLCMGLLIACMEVVLTWLDV